jgi:hypothetical protein
MQLQTAENNIFCYQYRACGDRIGEYMGISIPELRCESFGSPPFPQAYNLISLSLQQILGLDRSHCREEGRPFHRPVFDG